MKRIAVVVSLLVAFQPAWAWSAECKLGSRIVIPAETKKVHGKTVAIEKPKHAYRLADGSTVFLGRLTVDADGSPHAYNPDDSKGLDYKGNGGRPGDWWSIVTDTCKETSGTPVLQGPSDSAPGYYVSATTLVRTDIANCKDPRRYVDSEKIPYFAFSPRISSFDYENNKGNLAVAMAPSGARAEGVQADVAPTSGIGEGSIKSAQTLGYGDSPKHGGTTTRELVYLVLPDKIGYPTQAATVDDAAKAVANAASSAFEKWGGEDRLKACAKALADAPK